MTAQDEIKITEKFNDQHQKRELELIKSLNEMVRDSPKNEINVPNKFLTY